MVPLSPLASWILTPLAVVGFVVVGRYALLAGRWILWTLADLYRAGIYNRRRDARRAFEAAQAEVMGPYASKVVPFRRQA